MSISRREPVTVATRLIAIIDALSIADVSKVLVRLETGLSPLDNPEECPYFPDRLIPRPVIDILIAACRRRLQLHLDATCPPVSVGADVAGP